MSSLVVIPFYLIGIFFGLIAYTIYPPGTNSDIVLFKLMVDLTPSVALGVGVAAVLAVVLSTANTMILVIGATIFRDLFGRGTSEGNKQVGFSRVVTAGAGIIGAIYAVSIPDIVQLMLNAFFVIAVLSPTLIGVTIWKGATEKGATWGIVLGLITTIVFLFITPRQAFLPGMMISILSFIITSKFTKHSTTEISDSKVLFGS